jgi:hypothetical protein
MVSIARAASSSVDSVAISNSCGSLVWSMISTERPSPPTQMER